MARSDVAIRTTGLRELRRELKRVDATRDLRAANRKAADAVIPVAQKKGRGVWPNLAGGRSLLGGAGVASIKSRATMTKGYIVAGGRAAPWFGGVDWGSSGRYRQFGGRQSEGRIIYPAIRDAAPKIIRAYTEELDDIVSGAFPDGRLN